MWYVYILKNQNDNIYIGSTSDLKRRLKEHSTGQCPFTKHLLPIKLEAYIAINSEKKARELEKYLWTISFLHQYQQDDYLRYNK